MVAGLEQDVMACRVENLDREPPVSGKISRYATRQEQFSSWFIKFIQNFKNIEMYKIRKKYDKNYMF